MKVTFEQLKAAFNRVLISRGVDSETADACAEMFARTTESGVYSHGVNRFPRFIQQLENGDIIPDAQPKRITSLGAIEQWDAQRSIGPLNWLPITVLVWWHFVMPTTGCAAAATAGRRRKKAILAFAGPTPSP